MHALVHEVEAVVGEQSPEALAQVVVGVLGEGHLLDRRELVVARPDLLTGRPQVLKAGRVRLATSCRHRPPNDALTYLKHFVDLINF